MADLLALPPVLPDFLFCDPFYNSGEYAQLSLADCIAAEAQMPRGSVPTVWQPSSVDEENVHVFEIPKVYLAGNRSTIAKQWIRLEADVHVCLQDFAKSRLN